MKKLIRDFLNKCGFYIVRTKNQHDNLSNHLANKNIKCVMLFIKSNLDYLLISKL
jgi:hypothetical protein